VGRLAFDDPASYGRYVQSLIAYETASAPPTAREVAYWGTRHPADRATQMSADSLIKPLFEGIPGGDGPIAEARAFGSRCAVASEATRASLAETLCGRPSRPAVLVTASHGMGWPLGDPKQNEAQGALLTQDWSGFGAIAPEHYFSAADVPADAAVHGLVAFVFACYGLGTPSHDSFLSDRTKGPVTIADKPFVAALPKKLLSHPNGGALAVLGHVERAWGYSIRPPGTGTNPQIVPFRNFLGRILGGQPVGFATKDISEKYAVLAASLLDQLDTTRPGPRPSDDQLARTWIERNDAQNYALLGDPAARLKH
jgi:hypothetical protein